MDELAQTVPCVGCGTLAPRREMFGLDGELRCGSCADALRHRIHPAYVRSRPSTFAPPTGRPEGRATTALLATMGVLFLAQVAPTPLKGLLEHVLRDNLFYRLTGPVEAPTGWAVSGHPQAWQLPLRALMHVDVVHLLFNGLALFQMGRWIEWGWGARTFLLVLLGAAVAGVAAGWLVSARPTIGLSGGLFALDGWLLMQRKHHVVATAMVNRVFMHSLYANMVVMVILTETGAYPVSHVGHAAGFLWGLGAGYAARGKYARLGFALLIAATVVLVVLPTFVEPLGWRLTLFGRGR